MGTQSGFLRILATVCIYSLSLLVCSAPGGTSGCFLKVGRLLRFQDFLSPRLCLQMLAGIMKGCTRAGKSRVCSPSFLHKGLFLFVWAGVLPAGMTAARDGTQFLASTRRPSAQSVIYAFRTPGKDSRFSVKVHSQLSHLEIFLICWEVNSRDSLHCQFSVCVFSFSVCFFPLLSEGYRHDCKYFCRVPFWERGRCAMVSPLQLLVFFLLFSIFLP